MFTQFTRRLSRRGVSVAAAAAVTGLMAAAPAWAASTYTLSDLGIPLDNAVSQAHRD